MFWIEHGIHFVQNLSHMSHCKIWNMCLTEYVYNSWFSKHGNFLIVEWEIPRTPCAILYSLAHWPKSWNNTWKNNGNEERIRVRCFCLIYFRRALTDSIKLFEKESEINGHATVNVRIMARASLTRRALEYEWWQVHKVRIALRSLYVCTAMRCLF